MATPTKSFLRTIKEFQSIVLIELDTYTAGVTEIELSIEGNSILSTIFVSALTPGSSVLVEYYDAMTGQSEGEFYALASHPVILAPLTTNRLTVTRIHNRPIARVTVIGTVRFSLYATVVSSFASDLDAALQFEGEYVNLARHKGMPIAAYETTTDEWSFLRTTSGRLQVDVPNVIQTTQQLINKVLTGQSLVALPSTTYTHIDYTVPASKQLFIAGARGYSDSWTNWELSVNGVTLIQQRNNQIRPDVDIKMPAPYRLIAGDQLIISATNVSDYANNSIIKTYFYAAEEDI
jgi:hypothetical protein